MPKRYIATLEGAEHQLEIEEVAGNLLRMTIGGESFDTDVKRVGAGSFSVLVGDRSFNLDVVVEGEEMIVASRGGATRVTLIDASRARRSVADTRHLSGRAEIKAMMPGRVVNLLVNQGDEVAFQQGVLVVEAMKMENEIKSPKAGRVLEIKVAPGQTVEKGELLLVIE
jgi:biotin carboxyl carrier protein